MQAAAAIEDDATLVARARRGDERAFSTLYRRHVRYVAGALHRVLRSDDEVDDALQHGFADAYLGLQSLREPGGFRTWVTRIAVRRAMDRLTAQRRRTLLKDALRAVVPSVSDPAAGEPLAALQDALARVPPKYSVPWVLAEVAGHTIDEVADICDVSPSTAKRYIARAAEALERKLHAR